jgi:hypothetical protein
LTTKIYWMLASTMQFSSYGRDRDPIRVPIRRRRTVQPEGRSAWPGPKALTTRETVARSLRTQQRAKPSGLLLRRFHPHEAEYWSLKVRTAN